MAVHDWEPPSSLQIWHTAGPFIKYVTLFWTNFDPLRLPPVTHLGTP